MLQRHRIEIEASSQTDSYFTQNQKKGIQLQEIISLIKIRGKFFMFSILVYFLHANNQT